MPEFEIPMRNTDVVWMEAALVQAERAAAAHEVPVGALLIKDGIMIAQAANQSITDNDPTAHAEILVLRTAGKILGNYRLEGCELFVTLEPCAMCAGALVHARLSRLIYGASDPKAGAVESAMQVLNHPKLNHRMEVASGVLGDRCSELLQMFFRARRLV